jgi:hypothetical protein
MCLMCEEEAFFRAYWEQVGAATPPRQTAGATPDPARFSATAVEDAAAPPSAAAVLSDTPDEP